MMRPCDPRRLLCLLPLLLLPRCSGDGLDAAELARRLASKLKFANNAERCAPGAERACECVPDTEWEAAQRPGS